jgi:hypothetical protein
MAKRYLKCKVVLVPQSDIVKLDTYFTQNYSFYKQGEIYNYAGSCIFSLGHLQCEQMTLLRDLLIF